MRFLIDEQLPPGLARWLDGEGYPSDHVVDLGLSGAPDDDIEFMAIMMDAVIWSKDAGFVRRARQSTMLQVVWLRLGNTTNAELQARLAPRLQAITAKLADGEKLIEVR